MRVPERIESLFGLNDRLNYEYVFMLQLSICV